jgi:hypothetical protein
LAWGISLLLIGVVFVVVRRPAVALWNQWQLVRLHNAWASAVEPPGTIVYEDDPEEASKLLAQRPSEYQRLPYAGTVAGTDWNPVMKRPTTGPTISPPGPVALSHGFVSPSGGRYLLQIFCTNDNREERGQGRVFLLVASHDELATMRLGSKLTSINSFQVLEIPGLAPGDRVRVYAGQLDPSDASRFSIRLDLNKTKYVVRGRFIDAGKSDMKLEAVP